MTRSHTSYACDFLNSWIQSGLKSCTEFGFPEPSAITTPLPWPLAKNDAYFTDDRAPKMYSSNFWRR